VLLCRVRRRGSVYVQQVPNQWTAHATTGQTGKATMHTLCRSCCCIQSKHTQQCFSTVKLGCSGSKLLGMASAQPALQLQQYPVACAPTSNTPAEAAAAAATPAALWRSAWCLTAFRGLASVASTL